MRPQGLCFWRKLRGKLNRRGGESSKGRFYLLGISWARAWSQVSEHQGLHSDQAPSCSSHDQFPGGLWNLCQANRAFVAQESLAGASAGEAKAMTLSPPSVRLPPTPLSSHAAQALKKDKNTTKANALQRCFISLLSTCAPLRPGATVSPSGSPWKCNEI